MRWGRGAWVQSKPIVLQLSGMTQRNCKKLGFFFPLQVAETFARSSWNSLFLYNRASVFPAVQTQTKLSKCFPCPFYSLSPLLRWFLSSRSSDFSESQRILTRLGALSCSVRQSNVELKDGGVEREGELHLGGPYHILRLPAGELSFLISFYLKMLSKGLLGSRWQNT